MKRNGSSPSTGSARRGSRGDTQQKGNTMDDSGGHSGENLKKKRGARQKEVGIVMQQMANGASQIIIAHRVTT
jgi:hypothetical protein